MKLTLCGSTRFQEDYEIWNRTLTLKGHVVYSVAVFREEYAESKVVLDLVHLRKIMESDAIVVVGSDDGRTPYLGESTRREVMWAAMLGKTIYDTSTGELIAWSDSESQGMDPFEELFS